jgi:hypothetical protein
VACNDTPEVDADDLLLGGDTQAAILFEDALQLARKVLSPLAYLLANNNSNCPSTEVRQVEKFFGLFLRCLC